MKHIYILLSGIKKLFVIIIIGILLTLTVSFFLLAIVGPALLEGFCSNLYFNWLWIYLIELVICIYVIGTTKIRGLDL